MMFALVFFLAGTIFGDVGLHFSKVSSVGYASDVFHTKCSLLVMFHHVLNWGCSSFGVTTSSTISKGSQAMGVSQASKQASKQATRSEMKQATPNTPLGCSHFVKFHLQ